MVKYEIAASAGLRLCPGPGLHVVVTDSQEEIAELDLEARLGQGPHRLQLRSRRQLFFLSYCILLASIC